VNEIPALVLFDSGASHSFVSHAFGDLLGMRVRQLDCPLSIEVADDRMVLVTQVYRGCTITLCGEKFPIDLIPIATREICVIVGMDWLETYDAEISCRCKQIRVRTPSRGELVVQGDTPRR